jgi:hypothetical protein
VKTGNRQQCCPQPIHICKRGKQGPQGNSGKDGPQGENGPQGQQGINGIQGSQGPQGEIGKNGPQGSSGVDGNNGVQGPSGQAGNNGVQGERGVQGPAGKYPDCPIRICDTDHDTYFTTEATPDSDALQGVSENGFVLLFDITKPGGTVPVSGIGSRLMYHSYKSAFRSGRVTADQWDDPNIGFHSTGLGRNVIAFEDSSFASGYCSDLGILKSAGMGSHILGYVDATGSFFCDGPGSVIMGSSFNKGNITCSGPAANFVFVDVNGTNDPGTVNIKGYGNMIQGRSAEGGLIQISANGLSYGSAIRGETYNFGQMIVYGDGCFIDGIAYGPNSQLLIGNLRYVNGSHIHGAANRGGKITMNGYGSGINGICFDTDSLIAIGNSRAMSGSFINGYVQQGAKLINDGFGCFVTGLTTTPNSQIVTGLSRVVYGSFTNGNAESGGQIINDSSGSYISGAAFRNNSQIINGLLLHTNGTSTNGYVDFGGKMVNNGSGSMMNGYSVGLNALMTIGSIGTVYGSFTSGYTGTGAQLTNDSDGSFITGFVTILAKIVSNGQGTFTGGYVSDMDSQMVNGVNGLNHGCIIFGTVLSGSAMKTLANADGSQIFGVAQINSLMSTTSRGTLTRGLVSTNSEITTTGLGATAGGLANSTSKILSGGSGSWANGGAEDNSTINATNNGALANGYAINLSNINATGSGTLAIGYAEDNANIQAVTDGSCANGYAKNNASIQANGQGSTASGSVKTTVASTPAVTSTIISSGAGSSASGYAENNANIQANGAGSTAMGYAKTTIQPNPPPAPPGTSDIIANGPGTSDIIANGPGSLARGYAENTGKIQANGIGSTAAGYASGIVNIITDGDGSHTGGMVLVEENNITTGKGALTYGRHLGNPNNYSFLMGKYGTAKLSQGGGVPPIPPGPILDTILGEGSLQIAGGNDSNVTDGISIILGTSIYGNNPTGGGIADFWFTSGADYAEMFEWLDGNPHNEDRIGYFVENVYDLRNDTADKIMIAKESDDVIGIVSSINGTAGIIGDTASKCWHGANKRDAFGRIIVEHDYVSDIKDLLHKYHISTDDKLNHILKHNNDVCFAKIIELVQTDQIQMMYTIINDNNNEKKYTKDIQQIDQLIEQLHKNITDVELQIEQEKIHHAKRQQEREIQKLRLQELKEMQNKASGNNGKNNVDKLLNMEGSMDMSMDTNKELSIDQYQQMIVNITHSIKQYHDEIDTIKMKQERLNTSNNDISLNKEQLILDLKNCKSRPVTINNENYKHDQEYIPRLQRKEWDPIGLLGKLYVRDNGKCKPGDKCDCKNGIAVPGKKWRVLSRVNDHVIRILFK